MTLSEDKRREIEEAVVARRKIDAIKIHREATGAGLKESKDAVEEIEARLRATQPERFAAGSESRGCLGAVATLAVLVVLVILAVSVAARLATA